MESADNVGLGLPKIMDLQEFTLTTSRDSPPARLIPALEALWYVRKGNWDRAHAIVQQREDDNVNAVVHAHLHRIEGDLGNAGYWYRRAGKKMADAALEEEWKGLVAHFLG
ncbi:MAG TPA: hypothetical protein VKD04_11225, partial [Burkholderiales bacterium]|nr:hypothetical protein [Burkholderiales bacterium]